MSDRVTCDLCERQIPTHASYVVRMDVFAEQLRNFAKPGDVLMAISGSGNSPNVIKAVEYANSIDCKTLATRPNASAAAQKPATSRSAG